MTARFRWLSVADGKVDIAGVDRENTDDDEIEGHGIDDAGRRLGGP